jgi:two-component system NtrC family sensor kinase
MARTPGGTSVTLADFLPFDEHHYREIWRKQIVRLLFFYVAPLVVAITYFTIQYNQLALDGQRLHLEAIAGSHASTLNLFLDERIINLENLIDEPDLLPRPTSELLESHLLELAQISEAFVDLGFFDLSGVQTAYAGPYPDLADRNYSSEAWYQRLRDGNQSFTVTDIYLGFRQRPHFTIAVKASFEGALVVLRATLDPERIYEYMRSLPDAPEVHVSIVNEQGDYQLVTPRLGTPLESSSFVPPRVPGLGSERIEIDGASVMYAYSWLQLAEWALIVQPVANGAGLGSSPSPLRIPLFGAPFVMVVFLLTLVRARKLVDMQRDADRTRAQLEHASKLASVGELAAGIAHEINNPLAVINEEAGLLKDLMDPTLSEPVDCKTLVPYLDSIQESVFRCRDVTHKLLTFVRRSDVEMQPHDVNRIIDAVVDGLLGREFELSDIEVVRNFDESLPKVVTDRNQLQQVLLNLLNNAIDSLQEKPGTISIVTSGEGRWVRIAITDTGIGMTQDQLGRIFLPFYTTKEVGKGTGLGLSVSYGIIKDFGGEISVESTSNVGSTFTVSLPVDVRKGGRSSSAPAS